MLQRKLRKQTNRIYFERKIYTSEMELKDKLDIGVKFLGALLTFFAIFLGYTQGLKQIHEQYQKEVNIKLFEKRASLISQYLYFGNLMIDDSTNWRGNIKTLDSLNLLLYSIVEDKTILESMKRLNNGISSLFAQGRPTPDLKTNLRMLNDTLKVQLKEQILSTRK